LGLESFLSEFLWKFCLSTHPQSLSTDRPAQGPREEFLQVFMVQRAGHAFQGRAAGQAMQQALKKRFFRGRL
jgi:hypothetical protein